MRRLTVVLLALCFVVSVASGGCGARRGGSATGKSAGPDAGADTTSGAPANAASGRQVAQQPGAAPAQVAGGTVAGAASSDWPQFFGPYGNGLAPSQGLKASWTTNPPQKLWQTAMSDNGFAGPAVAGGKVYILNHNGQKDTVRCLDLASGKDLWGYTYDEPGSDNYGFSRATPCIFGGKVYTLGRSGVLNCLDASSGAKVWTRHLQQDFGGKPPQWNYAASPIVDGDKLIVIPGGAKGTVAALNKDSGQTIWQGGGTDQASYATPVPATINGVKQYIVFNCKALTGVDAQGGKLLWRVPWETGCDVNAVMPLVAENRVFITSGYGHGCALVEAQGNGAHIVWQNKAIQAHFSAPVLYNGTIYGIGDPGNLVCLEPQTGKVLWQQSGFEKGGQIVVDGLVLAFQGNNGTLVQVQADPSTYKEYGRFTPLGGQSWTSPIVAAGKMIVRNKTALACFQLN